MKKIRELFLLLFCRLQKAEECCEANSSSILELQEIMRECCRGKQIIEFSENSDCENGGFTVLDTFAEPPIELFSYCYPKETSITAEAVECEEQEGFALFQDGEEIYTYCPPEQEALHSRTIFVDNKFGDNFTGVREDSLKPFKTIVAAISAAQAGDTVHVRSGNFSENIILKDNVNLYFEEVTLTGTIKDNGVTVRSHIRGGLIIKSTANYVIDISGQNSNIIIDIIGGDSMNTFINIGEGTKENPNYLSFTAKYLKGLKLNYFLRASNNCIVNMNVEEYIGEQSLDHWTYAMFHTRGNFEGRISIEGKMAYVGATYTSELDQNTLLWMNSEVGGEVYVNIDKIENHSNAINLASAVQATISHRGKEKLFFKTEHMYCEGTKGIGFHSGGSMVFEGSITCNTREVVLYSSDGKLAISNSTLIRNYSNSESDSVVIIKYNAHSSTQTESNLKIDNTTIVAAQSNISQDRGVINVGELGNMGPNDINCYLTNVDIISEVNTASCIKSSTPRSVYLRDVVSNVDMNSNITDQAASTGLVVDAGLPKIY